MSGATQRAKALLTAVGGFTAAPKGTRPASQDRPILLATVDPAYTGSGGAKVTFDGESSLSGKKYLFVNSAALPGARVVLIPVGKTYVIVGTLGGLSTPTRASFVRSGDFRVNQRVAASGTSLASGAYFLDGWKSGAASNAVTWTGSDTAGRVLTIPASKSIQQIIEQTDVPGDTYTLVLTGTAQARVYNSGGSVPAYASGPITVATDGTANLVIEIGPGTVSKVAFWQGSTAYPFELQPIADELARARRHYRRWPGGAGLGTARANSATIFGVSVAFDVPMRATPTIAASGTLQATDYTSANPTFTATLNAQHIDNLGGVFYLTVSSASPAIVLGTTYTMLALSGTPAGGYVEASAEL